MISDSFKIIKSEIILKPNEEYDLSIEMKSNNRNLTKCHGKLIISAFEKEEVIEIHIEGELYEPLVNMLQSEEVNGT